LRAARVPRRAPGRPPPWAPAPLALLIALAAACTDASPEATSSLERLERLAFVEQGHRGPALLIERFETTREDWLAWRAGGEAVEGDALVQRSGRWLPTERHLPATYMNREEARAFAASRGMRLLTWREWAFAAMGDRDRAFPWGGRDWRAWQDSVANTLDLGNHRLRPVGTFESGSTPEGIYDLLGNAWEWVDDLAPCAEEQNPHPADDRISAMGGSYLSHARLLRERGLTFTRPCDPGSRFDDVGLRCGVEAAEYLRACAASWPRDAESRERLRRIGARWGRRAVPFLEAAAVWMEICDQGWLWRGEPIPFLVVGRDRARAAAALADLLEGARP